MSSRLLLDGYWKFCKIIKRKIFPAAAWVIVLAGITACGSNITTVDLPKDFIKDFIAKHETMVDRTLVYYYVKSDQKEVAKQVDMACRINESKGRLGILENAAFDFSGIRIELIDQKEEYVHDEPVVFVKVAVKGSYQMRIEDETRKIEADDIIVLQMAHNEWKVTNTGNPWS